MATYSVNQVRHLYVAKNLKTAVTQLAAAGDILPKVDSAKSTMYFQYFSPAGVIESSDKIDIKNITYAKSTSSQALVKKLDRYQVVLDSAINAGAPVAGQDYLLRLAFRQYVGLSPEDQYWKFGMVHAVSGMTASDFYKAMALSLARNIAREATPLVTIYLVASGPAYTTVTIDTDPATLTDTYTGIQIEQVAQDWILGVMPQGYIPFAVQPTNITLEGDERIWGTVTTVTPINSVQNGHDIADLEYFAMGARGDFYRNMGWPNVIHTTYLVDPTQKYDTLDISYYWAGGAEDVQKSPRTITLVTVDDGEHTAMKALIAAINAASGLTIADPA
jgi:hypothetical protein